MTLLEVCEPLFQYICRLNRSARKGVGMEISQVRQDIVGLFDELRVRADRAGLAEQYEKVRLPLVYFVDFMVKESRLDFARDWREMAHDENMFAGDEHFFDIVDETLRDTSSAAVERLGVLYSCIGLGFSGMFIGMPEVLRKKMLEISSRIRGMMESNESAKICPEAYEHVDTSDLIQPPGRSLLGIAIVLLALVAALVVGNIYLYISQSKGLSDNLKQIADQQK
ncbi:MAG: DotU family type IV/VI secretion system protein [Phycisphaeraceae bacterium]|nr:DotU family type IV/VI secretion system protein [Phycisphaeraceae bacterium]MCW5753858.1 DotU family type IV/VI secretion system protein [Phycisphaeraceae bacterium]